VFATLFAVSSASAEEYRESDLKWYLGIEALYDSNVNLSDTSPESDGKVTAYGGLSYKKDNGVTAIELGLKARNNTYFETSDLSNNEIQMFANAHKATYNGGLDAIVRYEDITDPLSQDLLLTGNIRRIIGSGQGDWNAEWQKTTLQLKAGLDRTVYPQDAFGLLDNNTISAGFSLGRTLSPKMILSFIYGHKIGDYDDESRIDFNADSFGLGVRYGDEEKLALQADISLSHITPEAGDARDTATGSIKVTWEIEREVTRLMVGFSRDVLPASVGSYSLNGMTTVAFMHAFNESVSSELATSYEVGDYSTPASVTASRFSIWGGASMSFGAHMLSYLRVKWMSRQGDGGTGLDYQDTAVTLGLTYDF
jgi:hypothetical protein